jgi:hypothetical protein
MTATPTPPPAAEPARDPSAATRPVVPYGPPVGEPDASVPGAAVTIDLSKASVAGTAGKWALRLLLPLVIRAIFRAVFR